MDHRLKGLRCGGDGIGAFSRQLEVQQAVGVVEGCAKDLSAWNVWLAPAGTPPEIVARLNSEIRAVLAEPEIASKMRSLGYEPSGTDAPAEVAALIARETRKWGDLIRSAGIKAD